jgi:hypothetical protein
LVFVFCGLVFSFCGLVFVFGPKCNPIVGE